MIRTKRTRNVTDRTRVLMMLAFVFVGIIVIRLFSLQILQYGFYKALAEGQHSLYEKLFPTRGTVYLSEFKSTKLYPLATNEPLTLVYANPSQIKDDPETVAREIAPILGMDQGAVFDRVSKKNDLYEPLKHAVSDADVQKIKDLKIAGIQFADEQVRLYPEGRYGSHLAGFLGYDGSNRKGQYGIEGAYNTELSGTAGSLQAEKDAAGRWIAIGSRTLIPAKNGDDIVLTIDRAIEHEACTRLDEAVQKHGADGGSVVVMDPKTGAILAMCGSPDYDPNNYSQVDSASVYADPALYNQYEPGSVMKGITMAAAIDQGAVTPNTTYTDDGQVLIGGFTIKNSDGKAHGVQTMTQVLEQSLNTGAIFAMRQIGPKTFASYLSKFGFGTKTGIDIGGESAGDISTLSLGKEIYAATASYGQGVTTTPLQMVAAYGAIANRGVLMKPYVVKEIRHADGTVTATQPTTVRQVISPQTATTVSAMLVNVVINGHGKKAAVPGYYIAGKTGTAQIPRTDGPGYQPDVTIGSFAGFGPVEDPKFVMIVRIDKPRDVQFAESSAAPLFGDIANFILHYLEVPPTVTTTPSG